MKCIPLKSILIALCAISLGVIPLGAIPQDAGSTGFNQLKNVFSARAVAMGQALTGIDKNPDGVFFNPAAIIRMERKELGSTYTNFFLDSQGGQLQYLAPKNKYTAWGFAIKYMDWGSFDAYGVDEEQSPVDLNRSFGAHNFIASASLAKYLSPMIDAGASFKVVYDQLDDKYAAAVLLDVGMIHHPENEKVKVGASVRNLGYQFLHYTDARYREGLPLTYAAGISYLLTKDLLGALDISMAKGENLVAKVGIEYAVQPALKLRMGLRSDAADQRVGGSWGWSSGLSLGAGWKWRGNRIDYGLSSYGDLGMIHQVSLAHEF
ncbi:MAG: PorV/PorQ family protein [Candidatus Cloacimonetes bacterium]|jgi:hypothetical protein|nr:PorV/PorQ family protein [Candidatus Cloacimonadota bacterium]